MDRNIHILKLGQSPHFGDEQKGYGTGPETPPAERPCTAGLRDRGLRRGPTGPQAKAWLSVPRLQVVIMWPSLWYTGRRGGSRKTWGVPTHEHCSHVAAFSGLGRGGSSVPSGAGVPLEACPWALRVCWCPPHCDPPITYPPHGTAAAWNPASTGVSGAFLRAPALGTVLWTPARTLGAWALPSKTTGEREGYMHG